MARSMVQFQKGLSERQFRELYECNDRCRAPLFALRKPPMPNRLLKLAENSA